MRATASASAATAARGVRSSWSDSAADADADARVRDAASAKPTAPARPLGGAVHILSDGGSGRGAAARRARAAAATARPAAGLMPRDARFEFRAQTRLAHCTSMMRFRAVV